MPKKAGLPSNIRMKHDYHLVDEIARRTKTPVIRSIPIERLVASEMQPRKDFGNLDELAGSIKESGILEPIIVRPKNGGFEIIAGERRYRAAVLVGVKEVPCVEYDVADNEALEFSLIENIQRKDLNVFEESLSLKALSEIYGYTHEEIAIKLGKSRVSITESIRIANLPNDIATRALAMGIKSKSFLLELAKVDSDEAMNHLLDEYQENSFSRDEVKQVRQATKELEDIDLENKEDNAREKPFRFTIKSTDKRVAIRFSVIQRSGEDSKKILINLLEQMIVDIKDGKIEGV